MLWASELTWQQETYLASSKTNSRQTTRSNNAQKITNQKPDGHRSL